MRYDVEQSNLSIIRDNSNSVGVLEPGQTQHFFLEKGIYSAAWSYNHCTLRTATGHGGSFDYWDCERIQTSRSFEIKGGACYDWHGIKQDTLVID